MADWTHCNICMRQPSTDVAFFLTGCGHILCKNCVDSGAADPQCKVCNQKSGVLEINRHLQPDLQEFFKDPKDLLVRYQQKLNKVFEFQSAHRKRINKYHKDLQQKATKMAQYFQNEMKKKSELERQYKMTKEQNKQLQEKITRQQEELRSYKTQMYQYQASAERHRSTQVPHYRSRSPNSTGVSDPRTPKNPLLMSFDSVVTSTPMGANSSNMSNLAARMSMAMNSGGGRAKMSAQDMQPSPAASIDTTPKMLGLRASSTTGDGGNPYLTVWHSQQRTTTTPKTTARINGLGSTSSRSRHATSPGFGSGLSMGFSLG